MLACTPTRHERDFPENAIGEAKERLMYLGDSSREDVLCHAGILEALLLDCHMSPWLGKQPAASGISNGMRLYIPAYVCDSS